MKRSEVKIPKLFKMIEMKTKDMFRKTNFQQRPTDQESLDNPLNRLFTWKFIPYLNYIMHIDLIRKIRNTLNINPDSKSTLVKKEHLLLYAKKLYE